MANGESGCSKQMRFRPGSSHTHVGRRHKSQPFQHTREASFQSRIHAPSVVCHLRFEESGEAGTSSRRVLPELSIINGGHRTELMMPVVGIDKVFGVAPGYYLLAALIILIVAALVAAART
jgi:hypothetical protein